jgi:hypothetical protein
MHKRTELSSGELNGSGRLLIELIEPLDSPPVVAITWPPKHTISSVSNFDQVVASAMRLLANASVRLSQIRRDRKL